MPSDCLDNRTRLPRLLAHPMLGVFQTEERFVTTKTDVKSRKNSRKEQRAFTESPLVERS